MRKHRGFFSHAMIVKRIDKDMKHLRDILQDIQKANQESLNEYIVKRGSEYAIMSKKGKELGKYPSRKQAVKRLRQIEYFKRQGE